MAYGFPTPRTLTSHFDPSPTYESYRPTGQYPCPQIPNEITTKRLAGIHVFRSGCWGRIFWCRVRIFEGWWGAVVRWIAGRCGIFPRDDEVKGGEDTEVQTSEKMYGIHSKHEGVEGTLVLVGTSEIPLAGDSHARSSTLQYNPQILPLRTVTLGHASRAEAGARGKDTRGLYRVHQFTKVKLFSVMTGESLKRTDNHNALPAKTDKASNEELESLREL